MWNRLCLDQAQCNDGLAHLAPFENLVSLSMNFARISSLSSMPGLNNLATLKLSDNKIKSGLESLTKLSALEKIYLGGNQIPDLESLQPLKKLSKLEWLDLEGNPVTKVPGYTEKVFEMLPALMVLDSCNRDGKELPDNDDDDEVCPAVRARRARQGGAQGLPAAQHCPAGFPFQHAVLRDLEFASTGAPARVWSVPWREVHGLGVVFCLDAVFLTNASAASAGHRV